MSKYKMLLCTPVKCYYNNGKGEYVYNQTAYYVGNGYCVSSITNTVDGLKEGVPPYLIKFDRCIPLELINKNYGRFKTILYPYKHNIIDTNFFYDAIFKKEDFNIENIEDFYNGHLDEFWWWQEIQNKIQEELKKSDAIPQV